MSDIDKIIAEEIELSEENETDAGITRGRHAGLPEGTTVTRGHGRSKTLQIRLNEDEYEALEHLAKSRELPVSTVARSLLLKPLRTDSNQAELANELGDLAHAIRRFLLELPK